MASNLHLLHHRKIARNQRGFSMIEVLLVVGLMTFVVLGNTMFINDFIHRMNQYEKESSDESQMAVLNIMAVNIMKKSALSYNRIRMADDNNASFYDYYPDLPLSTFGTTGSRSFTMTAKDTTKYFYLLTSDEADFDSLTYEPMHAYEEVTTPSDITQDGTIRYRGLNTIPDIDNGSGSVATDKLMSKVFGDRWANGKLFVLTCPTYLRPVSAANTINLMTLPRMPSFIGKVVGDDLQPLFNSEAAVTITNSHPVTNAVYNSVDQYLRTLPTIGGAAPFVKIEPAVLYRFEMRANSKYPAGYADLVMKKWSPGGYGSEIMVTDKIQSVEFKRSSIALPVVSLEVQK
ncbi:MAG: prepilin-type N-terminal cleavage/methylation domain-containing protein [Bdellovibrionales bacterium]|nr:prepilin-type N-terminal cleavage/methylation domain-containing protein [Bdellovibrionales bacterium]